MSPLCGEIWELGMNFDPASGGLDRYFSGLLAAFEKEGIRASAAAFGEPPSSGGCVRRESLGASRSAFLRRARGLRQLGKRLTAGEGNALLASHFALHTFLLRPWKNPPLPVVAHFHGPWAEESAQEGQRAWVVAAKRRIERHVLRRADAFITLSSAFRDLLVNLFAVDRSRVFVVPGSIDMRWASGTGDRAACRRRMGWSSSRTILLCVRRLAARMGLSELLDAFAKIAPAFPHADLHIAGRGARREELEARAERLGLGRRVRFEGFIPEERLADACAAADLSIVPSKALEGFGLCALESLACGTPVMVAPVGGLPEVVAGLSSSLLLPGNTPEAIAQGIAAALNAPNSLPSPEQCRRHVRENFSQGRMVRGVMEAYEFAAGGGR